MKGAKLLANFFSCIIFSVQLMGYDVVALNL